MYSVACGLDQIVGSIERRAIEILAKGRAEFELFKKGVVDFLPFPLRWISLGIGMRGNDAFNQFVAHVEDIFFKGRAREQFSPPMVNDFALAVHHVVVL